MLHIRTYRDGDEKELTGLFNGLYRDYAGFVPRTPEFWRWCCKDRPGVRDEGITIVESEGRVIGYAVVSDLGEILEFCYDPNCEKEIVVLRLLETIEGYLSKVGASSITLNAPREDPVIRRACLKLGYAESTLPYAFQLSVTNLPKMLREILLSDFGRVKTCIDREVLLKIKQASSENCDYISVSLLDGSLLVEERVADHPDFMVEASKQVFTSCIFGKMNRPRAVLGGRIKIRPFWKLSKALSFLSLLKLDDRWYVPLSDYG